MKMMMMMMMMQGTPDSKTNALVSRIFVAREDGREAISSGRDYIHLSGNDPWIKGEPEVDI